MRHKVLLVESGPGQHHVDWTVKITCEYDETTVTVVGCPDAVWRMTTWILKTLQSPDYEDVLRFTPEEGVGEQEFFPLIGEEEWEITVTEGSSPERLVH